MAVLDPQPDANGHAQFQFECDTHHLRGFSVRVSSEFAAALGVGPGGHATIQVNEPPEVPDVSLIWSATSHNGPLLGRVREPLTVINTQPDDMVTVIASDGSVRFTTTPTAAPNDGDDGVLRVASPSVVGADTHR